MIYQQLPTPQILMSVPPTQHLPHVRTSATTRWEATTASAPSGTWNLAQTTVQVVLPLNLAIHYTWKKHVYSILAKRYNRKSRKKPKNHQKSHIKRKPHIHHIPHIHTLQMKGRTWMPSLDNWDSRLKSLLFTEEVSSCMNLRIMEVLRQPIFFLSGTNLFKGMQCDTYIRISCYERFFTVGGAHYIRGSVYTFTWNCRFPGE